MFGTSLSFVSCSEAVGKDDVDFMANLVVEILLFIPKAVWEQYCALGQVRVVLGAKEKDSTVGIRPGRFLFQNNEPFSRHQEHTDKRMNTNFQWNKPRAFFIAI
jgi:hypothetical protein